MEQMDVAEITRRRLLQRGTALTAALAAPAVLAACGGGSSGTTVSGSATEPSSAARVPAASGTLDFLGYEGDDLPEIMGPWQSKSGVHLRASYINSESEIEAKVLGGGAQGVDMVSYTSPAASVLIEEEILAPLDPDKLPNLASLWPFFRTQGREFLLNDQGQWVGVPFFWGSLGLTWDTSVVPKSAVRAWTDILRPEFTGKVAVIDAPELSLYAAAAALGLESDKLTKADLQKVREWLEPVMGQVKTFSNSFGDLISLLGSKEVAAVFPGYAFISGAAVEQGNKDAYSNQELKPAVPVLLEAYGIPSTADNPDAAYAWINEVISPKINAQVAELQGAATVTPQAAKLISPQTRSLYPYASLERYFLTSDKVKNPPRESDEYATLGDITEMWAELKESAGGQ